MMVGSHGTGEKGLSAEGIECKKGKVQGMESGLRYTGPRAAPCAVLLL
jgi:hypothetical protein